MVFSLIVDVIDHPLQVLRAETDNSIPRLPLETFSHLVRTRSLQLADPFIEMNRRFHRTTDVDMIFDTADRVKICASRLNYLVLQKGVQVGLHFGSDQPEIVLCMPRYVEIYFGIDSN